MEELLNKLTEEQKTELGNLCQKINNIFEENDNFTEDEVDKFLELNKNYLEKKGFQVFFIWCE